MILTVSQYHTLCFLTKNYYTCSRWVLRVSMWQLYGFIICFRADPLRSSCMPVCLSDCTAFWNIHRSSVLTASVWLLHGWSHLKLLPSRRMFCVHIKTMHQFTVHIIRSHILRMHVWLAVTCYLHYWQNGLGLLRATIVTRGWNAYRNKSQHRKLTQENKILPPLLTGLEPATFRSRVQNSTTELLPLPGEFCSDGFCISVPVGDSFLCLV